MKPNTEEFRLLEEQGRALLVSVQVGNEALQVVIIYGWTNGTGCEEQADRTDDLFAIVKYELDTWMEKKHQIHQTR